MADGKKSFVLYVDLISIVEKLMDKDRLDGTNNTGELFLTILEYVNDRHPKPSNFIVEMAFEPIRLQLKRDLQRYEQIREKRAESGKLGGRPKKQTKTKKANGFSVKQTKTKKPDNVNDNVNDNVLPKGNNIIDTNVSTSNEQAHSTQHDDIDYKKLVEYFNKKTNGVFGIVRYPISDKRRSYIRARIREHGKEAFLEMIEIVSNSNFLKGQNKTGFRATFDWMILPTNFQKIIEGNYNNNITHNDSLLTYDQVALMVTKGDITFDMVTKIQSENGKVYYKRK